MKHDISIGSKKPSPPQVIKGQDSIVYNFTCKIIYFYPSFGLLEFHLGILRRKKSTMYNPYVNFYILCIPNLSCTPKLFGQLHYLFAITFLLKLTSNLFSLLHIIQLATSLCLSTNLD